MAAIAYPVQSVAPRRSGATSARRARRDRVRSGHLRLVGEPLFSEEIFAELESDAGFNASDWSVWQHPLPVIAHRRFVTTFDPVDPEAYRPSPVRHPVEQQVFAPETGPRPVVGPPRVPREIIESHPSARGVRSATSSRYRLRRFIGCVALGLALFGGLSAASAIAGVHQGTPAVIAGGVPVAGGYRYVVQPGDTLWSIASRVFPAGDPRALVAELATQIKSTTAVPGERLLLP